MSAWKPIETAPRDGSEMLVTVGLSNRVTIAVWMAGKVVEASDCEGWSPGYEPTHWMPLPEPPGCLSEGDG